MLAKLVASKGLGTASTASLAASVAAHAVVLGVAGAIAAGQVATRPDDARDHEAILLLPLLPASSPPEQETIAWQGGRATGNGPALADSVGEGIGRGIERGIGASVERRLATPAPELGMMTPGGLDAVYTVEDDLDHPAARDPLSAAPRYPEELLAARVEGYVVGEFTVDTLGRVEDGSCFIVESSHPAFAEALRDALPRMRFVPAEYRGHRVRQRVQQKFLFRVENAGPRADVRTE